MKKIAAYLFFLFSLFAGCVNEHVGESPSLVVIRGGQIQCAGRAAEENTRFQAGDVISFFSQGGIEADNVCLTYENGMWKHGGALSWNTSGKDASFTAFYPCFESGDWDYYDEDGFLEDIIFAKGEVSSGMFIELGFQHLFSKIIFEVVNSGRLAAYHVTPVVAEKSGLKRLSISSSVTLECIPAGDGIRYTAVIRAGKMRRGEAVFHITALDGNGGMIPIREFTVPVRK